MADTLIAIALLVLLALALERNHRRNGRGPDRSGLSPLDLQRIRAELDSAVDR
ncbi:hypothetical protein [Phaeacidiphilus oryzae]|jgi:hypothetical protein|uniref:hypothetical protein n=1 Tax=Phaeacidiphilus oryzae TaxID=348818 RepID=UPI000B010155|nr:hypothetical protein [Phaeacidiphilus oryzae]